jgi:Xaa-Pro aminopeptidase
VGAYLNVHEGPHMITMRVGRGDYPLEENMLVTNGMSGQHIRDHPVFSISIADCL